MALEELECVGELGGATSGRKLTQQALAIPPGVDSGIEERNDADITLSADEPSETLFEG